jgi:hypothetical protein
MVARKSEKQPTPTNVTRTMMDRATGEEINTTASVQSTATALNAAIVVL